MPRFTGLPGSEESGSGPTVTDLGTFEVPWTEDFVVVPLGTVIDLGPGIHVGLITVTVLAIDLAGATPSFLWVSIKSAVEADMARQTVDSLSKTGAQIDGAAMLTVGDRLLYSLITARFVEPTYLWGAGGGPGLTATVNITFTEA